MKSITAHMNRKTTGLIMAATVGVTLLGGNVAYSQWYLEVGPAYRGDIEVSVRGGSRAAADGLSAAQSAAWGGAPEAQPNLLGDDGSAQVYRGFDDGYVGPSGWDWARAEGWSQHFGYDDAGQYHENAGTVSYKLTLDGSAAGSLRYVTSVQTESSGWSGSERTDALGVMATLGYMFREENAWKLAAQVRVGWLDGIQGDFFGRNAYQQNIDRRVYATGIEHVQQYEYTYNTLGNPAFPDAPYAMTDPSGVGPLIEDTPSSIRLIGNDIQTSSTLIDQSVERAVSYVDLSVDASMFTFQAGPRLQWRLADKVELLLQPAVTINLVDADARRLEMFGQDDGRVIASWSERVDKQAWLMGAGIETGIKVALSETWSIIGSGGYEWVDRYHFSVGPDRVAIDLSGYQVGLAVGYKL